MAEAPRPPRPSASRAARSRSTSGDTIGSALYRAGVDTVSRSFKYHRRRGFLCMSGDCPNCLVQVDGETGVRCCTRPATDGMKVEPQNVMGSLERDPLAINDMKLMHKFLPVGFYYKTLIKPRWLWPQGRADDPQGRRPRQGRHQRPAAPPRARLPPPRRRRPRRRPGRPRRRARRRRGGRLRDRRRRGRAARQPARRRRDARRRARAAAAGRGARAHRAAARATAASASTKAPRCR